MACYLREGGGIHEVLSWFVVDEKDDQYDGNDTTDSYAVS